MSKYTFPIFFVLLIFLFSSCIKVEELNFENNFVIEAFIFGNEPIDNIKLKTTYPLEATEDISDPINDATVQLLKNGNVYELQPSGNEGLYHYAGNDLSVSSGDVFQLEVNYNNRVATANTTIPTPPTNVAINLQTVSIPRVGFSPAEIQTLREVLQGLFINVTWDNPNEAWYYVVVENIEQDDDPIFPPQLEEALQNFRFVSDPTQSNSQIVIGAGLRHYGTHKVTVYHVNQEYADLFENRTQDSRDLNEPPSNIENALGIFTGFASQSVFFEVVE
jgi:hypothetical protein